ncbi:MAG: hypothetical protein Q9202_003688 [Teloschistes flavicans]
MQDCRLDNSRINVKFAPLPQVVSAPRMYGLLMAAEKYAVEQMSQRGLLVDRPLREDELPFEFEGTGANRGFYIDVGQLPPGTLTWAKLRTTMRALEKCGFRRQIYRAIDFEIWEDTIDHPGVVQIGEGVALEAIQNKAKVT